MSSDPSLHMRAHERPSLLDGLGAVRHLRWLRARQFAELVDAQIHDCARLFEARQEQAVVHELFDRDLVVRVLVHLLVHWNH